MHHARSLHTVITVTRGDEDRGFRLARRVSVIIAQQGSGYHLHRQVPIDDPADLGQNLACSDCERDRLVAQSTPGRPATPLIPRISSDRRSTDLQAVSETT